MRIIFISLYCRDNRFIKYEKTKYRGNAVWRNGKVERVLFPGGYATLAGGREDGEPTFHYYTTDYLGNVRAVINGTTGETEQTVAYYPFGSVISTLGTNRSLQPYKFGGKELLTANGLSEYDFGARSYVPMIPAFTTTDPLCEKYYWLSPYLYCANNPVNYIDENGEETKLYATNLPGEIAKFLPMATHTFLTVSTPGKPIQYFAYGPEGDLIGKLTRQCYQQDMEIIEGIKGSENYVKNIITISPPDGMTSDEFDKKVIEAANSFGNTDGIDYKVLTVSDDSGNCNTSTYTILKKAGVSEDNLKEISSKIPGVKHGFGNERPWTKEEQIQRLEYVNNIRESIFNSLTFWKNW